MGSECKFECIWGIAEIIFLNMPKFRINILSSTNIFTLNPYLHTFNFMRGN